MPDHATVAPTGPTLTLSATTVARGQTIGSSVAGFDAGTTGIITIASVEQQIGSFTMPASGAATTSITIPTNITLGSHTVFARGTVAGQAGSASQGVTVVAEGSTISNSGSSSSTSGGSNLARTGIVAVPIALVGGGLVLGGLALKRTGKRSKSTSAR